MTDSSPGALSFDLTLRHQSCDPSSITAALGLQPTFSWAAGGAGPASRKGTCWNREISRGSGQAGFDEGTQAITEFLQRHGAWFREFTFGGGEVDVAMNYDLDPTAIPDREADDTAQSRSLVFDAGLYPAFIAALSAVGSGLQLRVFAQHLV